MSKSLKKFLEYSKNTSDDIKSNNNVFIGIVKEVVHKESDILTKEFDSGDLEDYVDNRNVVYVTPLDTDYQTAIVPAFFLNNHDMDVPIKGEAVLCVLTFFGSVIIDRLTERAYTLNYDKMDGALSGRTFHRANDITVELDVDEDGNAKDFINDTIYNVAPFFPKLGSRNFLGRNNQYIIFDHKERYESMDTEKQHTKDGRYVKIGFRQSGKQIDTREDTPLIILAKEAKLSKLLSVDYTSENKLPVESEPDEGLGIQSDEIIFIGKEFTCVYSRKDMLIYARENMIVESRTLEVKNKQTDVKSDRINLGDRANSPLVLGDKFINDFSQDLISIIENAQYLVATGSPTTTGISPTTKSSIIKFKSKYLRSNSPILSKNNKTK